MEKVISQRSFVDKENDFKKGNKREAEHSLMHKWPNSDKLYQSVSTSIQLKPTFLRKKAPLSNTAQFCTLYADQILKSDDNALTCPKFLAKHEIDSHLRAKMLDWMIEVTTSYRFTNKTFFDGIQIMDRYF